jgi:hypothetical protein
MSFSNVIILDLNQGIIQNVRSSMLLIAFPFLDFVILALLKTLACLDGSTIWFPERASRISGWKSRKHAGSRADANEDSEPQKSIPSV